MTATRQPQPQKRRYDLYAHNQAQAALLTAQDRELCLYVPPAGQLEALPAAESPWTYQGPLYGPSVQFVQAPGRSTLTAGAPARKRPPRPAVKDAADLDLRPDPGQAGTAAELVGALREFHQWAGEPSYRVMAEQCGQMMSASSLHRTLNGRALPPFKAVMAVIIGCGGSEEDQRRFASAWRMIRSGRRTATGSPSAAPLHAVRAS